MPQACKAVSFFARRALDSRVDSQSLKERETIVGNPGTRPFRYPILRIGSLKGLLPLLDLSDVSERSRVDPA
jgi:hypothetical protein